MAELVNGAWVLIADGEKALFLRNDVDGENPDLNVVRIEEQENPSDFDQSANKPGRKQDTGIGQVSAMEDTDWHQLAKERFADELADILYKQAHKNKFEKIVIAAPPKILGELRDKMHKEVSSRVLAEIDKDLTNHPIDKIEQRIKEDIASA
ncbi:host attachment family protein [Allosediminivita pacifica]|uniref:Protein required for attachment to host cells n=1 Tax=Allosediminivita pacifica TaxID=1267769 RepID=A0A2T6ARQ9_9RHOB|nr:host attachment family protein [Allosediminivita pacifica]PTX46491.1 protein required for attachment to host cells [Allosediminivita pacifica]GGB16752.1 host attachment protein [Allosediminivita pacifica]